MRQPPSIYPARSRPIRSAKPRRAQYPFWDIFRPFNGRGHRGGWKLERLGGTEDDPINGPDIRRSSSRIMPSLVPIVIDQVHPIDSPSRRWRLSRDVFWLLHEWVVKIEVACNATWHAEIKERSTAMDGRFTCGARLVSRQSSLRMTGSMCRRSHFLAAVTILTASILTATPALGTPFARTDVTQFAAQNFNEMVHGELKGIFYFHYAAISSLVFARLIKYIAFAYTYRSWLKMTEYFRCASRFPLVPLITNFTRIKIRFYYKKID